MQAYAINSSFFLHFVTKIGVFATSVLVFMALNLIYYVLHKPLLFSLFTHSFCFSLVPFEFFQMFKTFFGYEICLFRFVGCSHVQHAHVSFLHRRIQGMYLEMSPAIKLHLRHNLPAWLCLIANRQQQCFYLIISCIHCLHQGRVVLVCRLSPAYWSNGIISQWPPLSGPTRRRKPSACNFAIAFAIARREIPIVSAISWVEMLVFAAISSSIFCELFCELSI